jgi:hypothetical protein
MDQIRHAEGAARTLEGCKMKVPAAVVLAMLIATPAMAIEIVSGSGAVVKNGAGLAVVNGDPCAGQMVAACLDREEERRDRDLEVPVATTTVNQCKGTCEDLRAQ